MIKRTNWGVKVNDLSLSFRERLFKSRDVKEEELGVGIEGIRDYSSLPDIGMAVFEITSAMRARKRIKIFGDYDVDGTCATTILTRFFNMVGYPIEYHIPDRMTEGYGISDAAADKIIADADCDLIITVDNGIAAASQIKRIMDSGIRVVVTDHHECKDVIPACPVIDCKRKDSKYPFSEMCGAAVAMKLVWALSDELGMGDGVWKELIEYAAIATVADVVPLVDENRAIVKVGLDMLRSTEKPGLKNLIRAAGKLDSQSKLSSSDIGFYLAPLINASSRVGDVNVAMELLLTDDMDTAISCGDKLGEFNDTRKKIESEIYHSANMSLAMTHDFNSVSPIIVCGDNWHKGVIGIVAARLVEAYARPAIVLSRGDDGICHGSCRTYGDISVIDLLNAAEDTMIKYGGHAGAAGLSIEYGKLEEFREKLFLYARENYRLDMFQQEITADIEVLPSEITLENFEQIQELEPFGAANHDPVFMVRGVKVISRRKMGQKQGAENAHLKITVSDSKDKLNNNVIEGIGFYNSEFADVMNDGYVIDIIFKPSINDYHDNLTPQMMIQDIHCSIYQKEGVSVEEDALFTEDGVPIAEIAEEYALSASDYIPTIAECYHSYKTIEDIINRQANKVLVTDIDILSLIVSNTLKTYISPFKLVRIIEINSEAGYFYFKRIPSHKVFIALTDGKDLIKASETMTYKMLQAELEGFKGDTCLP